jgi:RHS repeat-associated protein
LVTVTLDAAALTPPSNPRREWVKKVFTLTSQTDDFASGNAITAVNGTAQLSLDPANAYDNTYTVHYFVSVTINASSTYGTATLVVALETNDGSGWVERATYSYPCSYPSGPPPYSQKTCSSWPHEQKVLTVTGLGLNDNVRLKAKSFSTSNGAGGSFAIRGGDAGGSNPETYNGVTYTTDVQPVSWPQSDDFPSGNALGTVGATTGLNLDPGGAFDNVYTVHYYVSVTINGHPSTYGTATLVVAIETNDGTGSGWVERAAPNYNCSYLSGPPPYSARTCPAWSHEQLAITVAGLGVNDSIRLKAKSFTTSNGAGGSFTIRGGDGAGSNPETYNGVTYATKVFRSVAVRPELPERQGFAAATGSQRFFVKNRGETDANLSLGFSCTVLTNCSVTPSSISLVPPGESRVVTLTYTLGAAGTTGTGMVKVFDNFDNNTLRDSASVAVKAVGAPAPLVSVVDVNPGGTLRRDLCVTVAAAASAAIECGDLRIVHALPSTRTLNKSRAPTLLYNSAHAELLAVIAGTVTRPSSGSVPDSVEGVIKINGTPVATGRWVGSDWPLGATRRIALPWAVSPDTIRPDTVYDYTFEAATYTPGRVANTATGKLIVVDRRGNAFGAGWSLAGVERLRFLSNNDKLWVGGDGSARIYQATQDTNKWVAAVDQRPDTLKKIPGGPYYRVVPGGAKIWFSTAGVHDSTVNRLGQRTKFGYTNGLLTSITLPDTLVSQPGGQVYSFAYDSSAPPARVVTITAPGTRVTKLFLSSLRVDSIQDPDNSKVRFTYENGTSRRIATRMDRRGTVTSFTYDAAKKLSRVHTDLQPDSIRLGFAAIENQGLATATPKTAIDTANAYTAFYGPRQYATRPSDLVSQEIRFYTDRFGATRRLRDALSYWTTVKREDGQWSTLPTELVDASGFVTRAGYDGHGNLIRQVAVQPLGPGQDAVTRYHWDPVWDAVDSIITPMGVKTTMAYDATNGNRLWQQVGSDPARRVTFRYGNDQKLLSSTVVPQTPADSIVYDGQWNVAATRTPREFWTSYYKDPLGRDTLIVTPIDSTDKARGDAQDMTIRLRQRTVFTVMDRDSIMETIAPNGAEEVRVDKRYDIAGNLLSLARVSIPDPAAIGTITTQWRYDRGNRRVAEVAPDGMVDSTDYDPAGNVVNAVTRRKDPTTGTRLTIKMTYDARNLPLTRVLPQVTYQSRPTAILIQNNPGGNWTALPYPAYAIPAETLTFTYDPLGRLLTAENTNAKVKRSYYPNGLIKLDSLRIQTVARDDWERHKYGLQLTYDLDGRRTVLAVPRQLGIGNDTTISYAYDPQLGVLQTLTDLQRNAYTFGYNLQADLSSLAYPAGSYYSEGLRYDPDGQLAADTIWNSGSANYPRIQSAPLVRATRFFYDARHRLQLSGEGIQLRDTLRPTYTGLGNLKSTYWTEHGCTGCQLEPTDRHATGESFTMDAFANLTQSFVGDTINGTAYTPFGDKWHYQSSTTCCDTWSYQPGTGRMTLMSVAQQYPRSFSYDSAGNQEFSSSVDPDNVVTHPATERASFFAADGSLRMVDARAAQVTRPYQPGEWQTYVVEDYRYDALGRRVWVRARKWCDDHGKDWPAGTECRVGVLRRTIWDGDQEVAEIQMPWALQGANLSLAQWDTTQTPTWWENDVTPVSLGRLNTFDTYTGDPNPYFGHVIYAGRRGIDQSIAVTRVNYVMAEDWKYRFNFVYNPPRVVAPFTIVPFWNARGDAPVGVFSNGYQSLCGDPNHDTACVAIRWPWNWSSSDRSGGLPHDYWHGTLLEGKRDGSGFQYARNRYYDPLTGRFTQEDPSGLAGGLNLYGFAAGDPINFGDPFGLGPDDHCEEHGLQDWPEYIELPGPPPSKTPIVVTIWHDCSKERAAEHERRRRLGDQTSFQKWQGCVSNALTDVGLDPETRTRIGTAVWGSMAALSAGLMGRRDALSILNQAAPFSGLTQTQLLGGVAPAVEGSIMLGGSNALIVLGLPFALLGAYTWQASLMCVFDTNAYL